MQRPAETSANLHAWEPDVRDTVFAFELASRIGFTAEPAVGAATDRTLLVWHLQVTENPGAAPSAEYLPLARFDRPSEATFVAQLDYMRAYADLRPDRAVEIVEQLDPPEPFIASIGFLRPDTKRWTSTLLGVVLDLARLVEQRVKHGLACRRPIEYSPQVQPIILTPGHGTLPSGHATEAFATALVFWRLLQTAGNPYGDPGYGHQFMRLASRIAVNRTVAGVHFPLDSVAGAMLGLTLGDYFLARVGAGGRVYAAAHFDGTAGGIGNRDFLWSDVYDVAGGAVRFSNADPAAHPSLRVFNAAGGDNQVDVAEAGDDQRPLAWLWQRAAEEWT